MRNKSRVFTGIVLGLLVCISGFSIVSGYFEDRNRERRVVEKRMLDVLFDDLNLSIRKRFNVFGSGSSSGGTPRFFYKEMAWVLSENKVDGLPGGKLEVGVKVSGFKVSYFIDDSRVIDSVVESELSIFEESLFDIFPVSMYEISHN
jgi:hypothetical protein